MKKFKLTFLLGVSLSLLGNAFAIEPNQLISEVENDQRVSELDNQEFFEVMDFVHDNAETISSNLKNQKDIEEFKDDLLEKSHHRGRIGHRRGRVGSRRGSRGRRGRF